MHYVGFARAKPNFSIEDVTGWDVARVEYSLTIRGIQVRVNFSIGAFSR